jgi:RHS repeat-associated protein
MTPGVVAETDLAGNTKSEYVFFDGERIARRDGVNGAGGVFYYFSDHLKTASVVTDSLGNIKSESDFYPWGGELQFTNNDSNHYKFTGKERDSETGLDYFGARYFSNGLGRFLVPDWVGKPITVPYANFGNPQSLNLYSYVVNNPMTLNDPDGHEAGYTYNHDGTMTAPTEATTDGRPIRDTVALGIGTAASLAAPGSGTLIRNLFGLGLVTAPVTVPIATGIIEGMTPGAPSLSIASAAENFGFKSGFTAAGNLVGGELKNGGSATAVFAKIADGTLGVGVQMAGSPQGITGTLKAIEQGALKVGAAAGAKNVTIVAKDVTKDVASVLEKKGFTQVLKDGKETPNWTKTYKVPGQQ